MLWPTDMPSSRSWMTQSIKANKMNHSEAMIPAKLISLGVHAALVLGLVLYTEPHVTVAVLLRASEFVLGLVLGLQL